jgi:predicted DsbA family dithiol-disulfide isomerase
MLDAVSSHRYPGMMAIAVHIWSDVACPWCFIGKLRFEEAVQREDVSVDVTWHAYELDPRPRTASTFPGYVEWLSNKHGVSLSQARSMTEQMTERGRAMGIVFDFATAIPANTFDAHRLLCLAHREGGSGKQSHLKQILLQAHFTDACDLNLHQVLLSLAVQAGLDEARVSQVLASEEFADEVREDERTAQEMRIGGVPFFVIGKSGVAGAQSVETFASVLREENACSAQSASPRIRCHP